MQLHSDYSLKQFNTFGIDVSAALFAECSELEQIVELLSEKAFSGTSKLILGGGSNLLFTKNFDGLVIKNNLRGIQLIREDVTDYYVKAMAGEVWHEFVRYCIGHNYAGLENLSLIPGNVGASPMQNIGAYGAEIKDHFFELEALHIPSRELHTFDNAACEFGYRESIFKRQLKNQYIIVSVTFKLPKKPTFNTSYGAIESELEKMGITELSAASISEAVCNIRRSKLPDPAVTGNAGSFFKNPEVSEAQYLELQTDFPAIVGYPLSGRRVKLAAGWLIEQCGWKGKHQGQAGVHKMQALVLINLGNASGQEILDLSSSIMDDVKQKFGVQLEREVNIV